MKPSIKRLNEAKAIFARIGRDIDAAFNELPQNLRLGCTNYREEMKDAIHYLQNEIIAELEALKNETRSKK